ncbi:DUF4231 domain-containing protein [Rhizobium lusitanum]|uniref:Cell division protein ZapA (FtsZ GTPase activity inhibitor) n=1 Tax=Rhizobium lusitanum TaxID=293958 RepID=A0A7X0IXG8_9HYPH|nr:DUF4231 domain-containing protein [Rhizobium lusitanum]MBB6487742.1 cell division protein ZapA (FtsZ GTPase activity inhibitor) [Rhizobium lusitanum]
MKITLRRVGLAVAAIVVFIVLWSSFCLFVYGAWVPTTPEPHECKQAERVISEAKDFAAQSEDALARLQLICAIKRANQWYYQNAKINQILYSSGTLSIIFLSFFTALLIAAEASKKSEKWRILTLSLPLLSTAVATTMSQFHFQESWELRENGRIAAEDLLARTEMLPISKAEFSSAIADIRQNLVDLQKSQASRYFAYRFTPSDNPQIGGNADDSDKGKSSEASAQSMRPK